MSDFKLRAKPIRKDRCCVVGCNRKAVVVGMGYGEDHEIRPFVCRKHFPECTTQQKPIGTVESVPGRPGRKRKISHYFEGKPVYIEQL